MSETETTVPMDDKAMFEAATSDAAPQSADAPAPEPVVQTEDAGPARDEHGRFAAKDTKDEPEQPAVTTTPEPAKPDNAAQVPSWRLAEVSEARRAAEARAQDLERHVHQLSGQLRQFTEKAPEPIDPYVDPEKFADQRARQAVDPVKSQVDTIREYYSRKDAIKTHGADTVTEAYKWLDDAARSRNPNAIALLQRVMTSIDPFEEIVTAYKSDKALATVGNDPNAWFEKELERRLTDPAFKAKLNAAPAQASPTNIVKLPPSLNRAASGGNKPEDPGDMSDPSLFAYATR